ncbi:MAG TPA: TetR/AcrR family transcriptional regulator [Gammaproteobacteria bacterium]
MARHTPPGRPADPQKDAAILAAGRRLLFSQGPQAVSMEAVARLAAVSKVTVYARYRNRDALIRAVIADQAVQLAQDFRPGLSSLDDVRSALVDFGVRLQTFLLSEEHLNLLRTLSGTRAASRSQLHTIYRNGPQATVDGLVAWLSSLHAADVLDCPEPADSAVLLLGMLQGLDLVRALYRVDTTRDQADIQRYAEHVADVFLARYAPAVKRVGRRRGA